MRFRTRVVSRLRRCVALDVLCVILLAILFLADLSEAADSAFGTQSGFSIGGYAQSDIAYTVSSPEHWSRIRNLLEIAVEGKLATDVTFKVSGRGYYDGAFDVSNFFPHAVKRDEGAEAMFRETYIDASAGNWGLRVGRQNIIWGEVIGLFFADVVSAKDLRDNIIPDLDQIRIPQWATRVEYFKGDFHGEAIWVPYMSYDRIGKPGSDFYPFTFRAPPGVAVDVRNERFPAHTLANSAFGFRLGYLLSGWDLTGFYYNSIDASPTLFRQETATPVPTFVYRPGHDRINQTGGTVSKDFQSFIFRGEAVYTWDRWFSVSRINDSNGAVRQDFLNYILGIEFPLPLESRLNVQFFQSWFPHHDPDIPLRRLETGATLFGSIKLLNNKVEPDLLLVQSFNRPDWLARLRVTWQFITDWRLRVGAAFFGGDKNSLFGRFDNRDRVYAELRYAF